MIEAALHELGIRLVVSRLVEEGRAPYGLTVAQAVDACSGLGLTGDLGVLVELGDLSFCALPASEGDG